jgi:hypothetical protein
MSEKSNPLDGLSPEQQQAEIDRARLVLKEMTVHVLDELDERSEQLYSLAYALEKELTPPNPNHLQCDHPTAAWRLSQILTELLGNTAHICAARSYLLGKNEADTSFAPPH